MHEQGPWIGPDRPRAYSRKVRIYVYVYIFTYIYILSTVVCTNLAHSFKVYMSGTDPADRVAEEDPISTELL